MNTVGWYLYLVLVVFFSKFSNQKQISHFFSLVCFVGGRILSRHEWSSSTAVNVPQ